MSQGPATGYNNLWVKCGPHVFETVPQEHPLPFHIQNGRRKKKKKESGNWDTQGQVHHTLS